MTITGVISADIVGSTSIALKSKIIILKKLKSWLAKLDTDYQTVSRITKGDLIEIAIPNISLTMRVAFLLKAKVKMLSKSLKTENKIFNLVEEKRLGYFKQFGVRMAIDIGNMEIIDKAKGIFEGEAIYNTGRRIGGYNTHERERIVIKNTISFTSIDTLWEEEFDVVFSLIDFIVSNATARQCEILMYKLSNKSEQEIAEILKIKQPGINQISKAVGWREIEKAINRFEKVVVK